MVAPAFLQNPQVLKWLAGSEPAWTMLEFQSFNALQREPSRENHALRLASDLLAPEIDRSAVARNTLILLRRAVDSDGLKLTAAGNLSRAVVDENLGALLCGIRSIQYPPLRHPVPVTAVTVRLSAPL